MDQAQAQGRLYLGCAVWAYAGWKGGFYPADAPAAEMLDLYVRRLHAVEGNTTFYAAPPAATIQRWAERMPVSFRFCPKLPREVTHEGELIQRLDLARAFVDSLAPLGDRLGLVFAQLPPGYGPDRARDLVAFLDAWPHGQVPLGVELRNAAWFEDRPGRLLVPELRRTDSTHVVLDTRPIFEGDDDPQASSNRRKPKLPVRVLATARRCMVRYIGHPTLERNRAHLQRWAKTVHAWLGDGRDVFFFCHCPEEEQSPVLARTFHTELTALRPDLEPLPWDTAGGRAGQLDLF